jgi:hypothetical protein
LTDRRVVELAQTGSIPSDAKSIHFYTSLDPFILSPNSLLRPEDYDFSFKLNGEKVPVSPIEVGPFAILWAGDVSKLAGTVGYQWLFNGTALAGQTNSALELENVQKDQAGEYAVTVGNARGNITTPSARLAVDLIASWQSVRPPPSDLSGVVAIAAGAFHAVALKGDGKVTVWGDNNCGQTNVPARLSNVVAIAAGFIHSLALNSDGKVVGWGGENTGDGQSSVPGGFGNVVAIAAGSYVSLAAKSDGTVVGWGAELSGKSALPPNGLTKVVAIGAGMYHGVALSTDGTVTVWGDNRYGQLDVPPGLSNVVAVACGEVHTLVLKSDGTVVGWGGTTLDKRTFLPG